MAQDQAGQTHTNMTLCVLYKFDDHLYLISDIVLSVDDPSVTDVIPTTIIPTPDSKTRSIVGLDRKIVKIQDKIAIQWSGDYDKAVFATKMLKYHSFEDEKSVEDFLDKYCTGLSCMISGSINNRFVFSGRGHTMGAIHKRGFVCCIGSGSEEFMKRFFECFPVFFPEKFYETIGLCLSLSQYDRVGLFDHGYGFWFEVYHLSRDYGFQPLTVSTRDLIVDDGTYFISDRRTLSYYDGDDLCLLHGSDPRKGIRYFFLPCIKKPKSTPPPPLPWKIKPKFTLTNLINAQSKVLEGYLASDFGTRPEEKFLVNKSGQFIDLKTKSVRKILDRFEIPRDQQKIRKKSKRK